MLAIEDQKKTADDQEEINLKERLHKVQNTLVRQAATAKAERDAAKKKKGARKKNKKNKNGKRCRKDSESDSDSSSSSEPNDRATGSRPSRKAAAKTEVRPSSSTQNVKFPLAYPGVPKAAQEKKVVNGWNIYTDITKEAWRCMKVGGRHDVACSWKHDPRAAWAKVNRVIQNKNVA